MAIGANINMIKVSCSFCGRKPYNEKFDSDFWPLYTRNIDLYSNVSICNACKIRHPNAFDFYFSEKEEEPMKVKVIGAGLAGSEAAWQLANRGLEVELYEMRPVKKSPAHHTGDFAELVCSNSLRGDRLENAVGLLKEEMRQLLRDIFSDKISTTVLNEDKPAKNDDHPTMKPLKLLARLVKNSSRQGEIVIDTFGGSGSTLITCQQLGRRCYTMELDPKYADVIVKRYMKFTGATQVEVIRDGQKIVVT